MNIVRKKMIRHTLKKTDLYLLTVLLLASVLSGCSTCPPTARTVIYPPNPYIDVVNPYESVDWDHDTQYRANLHTHTTESDGWYSPDSVIDMYHEAGYSILAITDHDRVTWPWETFGRNPDALEMVAVKGNEVSSFHHLGSYFCDYEERFEDEYLSLLHIGDMSGLAVFFHPGRYDYPAEWYAWFYQKYDHLIGMEVVNQRDKYPGDRALWDRVLTLLMPKRAVWGFANDDMHLRRHFGAAWNVFPLSELNEAQVRLAMENGIFYFCHGELPPRIHAIEADNSKGYIKIDACEGAEIVWISAGRKVHAGKAVPFREKQNVTRYLRAEIRGENGITYTNPFAVVQKQTR